MMIIKAVAVVILGYFIGALPMGYLLVKLIKKQDITLVGSGRTGGTNAMRAGGVGIGVLTAIMDISKGYISVWFAQFLLPNEIWVHVATGIASVFGHNWSIWLYLWKHRFSAGAGTGPNIGAAAGFWPGIILYAVPAVVFFVLVVGYASLASLFVALMVVVVFTIRAVYAGAPWQYIVFAVMTMIGVVLALLPNIRRLRNRTERRVGVFAKEIPARINH